MGEGDMVKLGLMTYWFAIGGIIHTHPELGTAYIDFTWHAPLHHIYMPVGALTQWTPFARYTDMQSCRHIELLFLRCRRL